MGERICVLNLRVLSPVCGHQHLWLLVQKSEQALGRCGRQHFQGTKGGGGGVCKLEALPIEMGSSAGRSGDKWGPGRRSPCWDKRAGGRASGCRTNCRGLLKAWELHVQRHMWHASALKGRFVLSCLALPLSEVTGGPWREPDGRLTH